MSGLVGCSGGGGGGGGGGGDYGAVGGELVIEDAPDDPPHKRARTSVSAHSTSVLSRYLNYFPVSMVIIQS